MLSLDTCIIFPEKFDIQKTTKELFEKGLIVTESVCVTKNGEEIPIEINSQLIKMNDRVYILSIFKDITVSTKIKKQLLESEERCRKLIELLPDAVLVHAEEDISYANQKSAELFGFKKPGDLIGQNIMNFVHPDYYEEVCDRKYYILKKGENAPLVEQKIIAKDGKIVDIEVAGTAFYYQGKLQYLCVARDISDRKRDALLQKQMEKERNLLKEALEYEKLRIEFFANLSHEFKTPITLIFSIVQLFEKDIQSNSERYSEKSKRNIKILKQNCYRIIKLVDNLIDITRMEVGYYQIKQQNCNIVSVVEDIVLSAAEYMEVQDKSLIFDTNIEEKIMAFDPNAIERIILNLLSNAAKFTRPKDKIIVSINDEEEDIIISVKDTGAGIPKDKLEVIFERFRQIDKSLTRSHEGSGIGLSIVKHLVNAHNGTIIAKSKYGEGTEFVIRFPIKLIETKDNTNNNLYTYDQQSKIERIRIEFSDIYL